MKIFARKISKNIMNSSDGFSYFKTKSYPEDRVEFTSYFKPKTNLWQKFRNIIGLRTKLNPKSFSDATYKPKGQYIASRQSVNLSDEYIKSNCLMENEKIIDGFRDAGSNAVFDNFANVIKTNREVITIDRNLDSYLSNAINYVKANTYNLSEEKKIKFVYNLVHDISGDFYNGATKADMLGKAYKGKEILLGQIFEDGAATCRHKALMFKILAEEAGIKTRLLRGVAGDLQGIGGHAWNEVKMQNGKKMLVDVQNSRIIEISSKSLKKHAELALYMNKYNEQIYK